MKPKLIAIEFDGENYTVWEMKPGAVRDSTRYETDNDWREPQTLSGEKKKIASAALRKLI
jgi:hypothetical protein